MRTLLGLILVTLVGCVINNGTGSGSGFGDDTGICDNGDHCTCPLATKCIHDCTPGADECHVEGAPGEPVNVKCDGNGDCHVECSQASSCEVDCGGSTDCHVTCPLGSCEVTECDPADGCAVSCGTSGRATQSGTTATCP